MIPLSIDGKSYSLNEKDAAFQGSEGRLFRLPDYPGKLFKIYKTEADFPGQDADSKRARDMANNRGRLLFKKLRRLPPLPPGMVEPEGMILSSADEVGAIVLPDLGDAFTLQQFKDAQWRKTKRYSLAKTAALFIKLRALIVQMHDMGAVFGDLKPSNVLVKGDEIFIIDVESMGIAGCPATGFTWEYADPNWVGSPLAPPNEIPQPRIENDWYSFAVMYFEVLTGVHPFAGIHMLDENSAFKMAIQPEERMVQKLSVLNERENIVLRAIAKKRLKVLTSSESAYFRRIFEGKIRSAFNLSLLESRTIKQRKNKKTKKVTKPKKELPAETAAGV